jgi:hypothetical protein
MDTSFTLERNPNGYRGYAKLSCDKQKDHMEPPDLWMQHQHIKPKQAVEGSIVLIETQAPGAEEEEARAAENEALQAIINSLLVDENYKSDRARAKVLAAKTGIPEATAQTKIHRTRKKSIENEVNVAI